VKPFKVGVREIYIEANQLRSQLIKEN